MFGEVVSTGELDDLRKGRVSSLGNLLKLIRTDKNSKLATKNHFENPLISTENELRPLWIWQS